MEIDALFQFLRQKVDFPQAEDLCKPETVGKAASAAIGLRQSPGEFFSIRRIDLGLFLFNCHTSSFLLMRRRAVTT